MDVTPTHPHTGQPNRGWRRWRGMFNLNDPRWGRDEGGQDGRNDEDSRGGQRPRGQGPNQGPPDLDELWRDFNRKLGGLLGNRRGGGGSGQGGGAGGGGGGGGGGFTPNPVVASHPTPRPLVSVPASSSAWRC